MKFPLEQYRSLIESFYEELEDAEERIVHTRLSGDAWALIEIVGHLVDSAVNNHQRFVRLQLGNLEAFPGYDGEKWILVEAYRDGDWKNTIALWYALNIHLLHVVQTMDSSALTNTWTHEGEKLTLRFLVEDYYRHLAGHIEHYRRRLEEVKTAGV